MARREITRSPSASTLSCITVHEDGIDVSSAPPSTTPPTRDSDVVPGASTNATRKPKTPKARAQSRIKRRRVHERVEGIEHQSPGQDGQPTATKGGSRVFSGETLVENVNGEKQGLKSEGTQTLNKVPYVDRSLEKIEKPGPADGMKTRRSTRLDLLQKATNVISVAKTALGKRGREVIDVGRDKLKALKGDRRASLRPRINEAQREPSFEGPLKKSGRLETEQTGKAETTTTTTKTPPKPKTKRWLSQGLYVGQERDFDPRFTGAKNQRKKALKNSEAPKQNTALPMPMFAGQRLLEQGRDFKLPFEVFSPLPPGQPKPEEWKKTQKST